MQLIFTRSGKIGSRLIQYVLNEPISHVAILFSTGIVVHSTFSGVQMAWADTFRREQEVVATVDIPTDDQSELDIMCGLLGKFWGRGYDWGAAAYLAFAGLRRRWFGVEFPSYNAWNSEYYPFCAELASLALGWDADPMTTPLELYLRIQLDLPPAGKKISESPETSTNNEGK